MGNGTALLNKQQLLILRLCPAPLKNLNYYVPAEVANNDYSQLRMGILLMWQYGWRRDALPHPALPYPYPSMQVGVGRALPAPQQQRHPEEWPYAMPGHHSRTGLEDVGVGKPTLK